MSSNSNLDKENAKTIMLHTMFRFLSEGSKADFIRVTKAVIDAAKDNSVTNEMRLMLDALQEIRSAPDLNREIER
jgi:hypothetical protein